MCRVLKVLVVLPTLFVPWTASAQTDSIRTNDVIAQTVTTGERPLPSVRAAVDRLILPSYNRAAEAVGPPAHSPRLLQAPTSRDSLKNGAITGAIAGAAAGTFLAAVGCAVGEALGGGGSDSSCLGGTLLLVGIGAGIGAGIGVAVDALFEQGPSPALAAAGNRTGVRLRVAF